MARARNIKPGFFKNEELVELPFETRLLFIGLWTMADREGRLEDRPKKIKMELFPEDDLNIDNLLNQLAEKEFILRYEVEGCKYIEVLNFKKHQNPHHKEQASSIPAPDKPQASPGQVQDKPDASPSDSLISDSLNLIPEVEELDATEKEREILKTLKAIPSYPTDYPQDLDMLRNLAIDFPAVDILAEAKKWRDYKRDKPLRNKSSPRLQLRNWMKNAQKWSDENGGTGTSPGTNTGHSKDGGEAGKYDDLYTR